MTFRVQTTAYKGELTFVLSGHMGPEGSAELQRLIGRTANGHPIVFDLRDIRQIDRMAITALIRWRDAGVELRNCPAYVRDWMARELKTEEKKLRRKRK